MATGAGRRGMANKIIDADKESEYGYVFGVSGPGVLN